MRHVLLFLMLLLCPCVAYANPVNLNPQPLIAFMIVAFWALVVESGIATLVVVGSGIAVVPFFMLLVVMNVTIYIFGFYPLIGGVSLWLLEFGVIVVDALIVMLMTSIPFLEGVGVTWRQALLASTLGNAASFFVGVIATGNPWFT